MYIYLLLFALAVFLSLFLSLTVSVCVCGCLCLCVCVFYQAIKDSNCCTLFTAVCLNTVFLRICCEKTHFEGSMAPLQVHLFLWS